MTAATVFAVVIGSLGCGPSAPSPASNTPAPKVVTTATEFSVLDLRRAPQRSSIWCWAASTQMTLDYLLGNDAPALCGPDGIVSRSFPAQFGGMPEECETVCQTCGYELRPASDHDLAIKCLKGGWPRLSDFNVSYKETPSEALKSPDAALSWDELKEQLLPAEDGRTAPVLFAWAWSGGGGHVMVANGFAEAPSLGDDGRFVLVEDPWPPCVGDTYFLTYSAWVGSEDTGRQHWRDYWDLKVEDRDGPAPAATPDQPAEVTGERSQRIRNAAAEIQAARTEQASTTGFLVPLIPVASPIDSDGEGPPGVDPQALAKARSGLKILKDLAAEREKTRQQLGFFTPDQLQTATLSDKPVWEVIVSVDQLEEFDLGEEPEALLRADGWIFPVTGPSGGANYTAIRVDRGKDGWFLAEMGGRGWIGKLAQAYASAALQKPPWPIPETFLVSVPGLRRYYLARHFAPGDMRLIQIPNMPSVPATDSRPVDEVFAELAEKAGLHDGEPG